MAGLAGKIGAARVEFSAAFGVLAASASRILAALSVIAVLARLLSPADFGIIAQITAVVALFGSFAGGAVTNQFVVDVARAGTRDARLDWLAASYAVCVCASAVLCIAAAICSFYAEAIFGDARLAIYFAGIAAVQFIIGIGANTLSFSTATRDVRSFALASIVGNAAWLLATVAAAAFAGFTGAAVMAVLAPVCVAATIVYLKRSDVRAAFRILPQLDHGRVRDLLKASLWMVPVVVSLPVAASFVRSDFGARVGWDQVGIWQASARMSDAYMQFFAALVINRFLPQMAVGRSAPRILKQWALAFLALFAFGALVLMVFRDSIIVLAFSSKFTATTSFVGPQLLADFAKVFSWLLLYRQLAADRRWTLASGEFLQAVVFVVAYLCIIETSPTMAPVYGYLISAWVLLAYGVAISLLWPIKSA